ncbi:MAG: MFS transporter [Alphaproteobacteria bacterium]|nr:MFS transporter [Alphaproteobacteria bacterium]
MKLLFTRRFLPLFATQTLGAFNDNVMKNGLVMLITFRLSSGEAGNAQMLVTLAAALFILPYFLFSATAGQLADKFDRAKMARATKLAEIVVMAVAAAGFILGNTYFLLFVLFCLGVQATFFSPIKYALLPQHLKDDELVLGNAYIEAGMFLAILLGTIAGGLLVLYPSGVYYLSAAIIACSLGGYATSRFIPASPAPDSSLKIDWNIARQTWRVVQHDRKNPVVFSAMLAISWFWLVGATYLSQFPSYAKDVLHADETVVTLFLSAFSIGIAIGSFVAGALLRGAISAKHVPMGGIGMCLFGVDLFFASGAHFATQETLMTAGQFLATFSGLRIFTDLIGFAICAGIFIVPLYAVMQHESELKYRARTIATCNILNALFMVLSSVVVIVLMKLGATIPQIFLAVALANGVVALRMRKLAAQH